jgi:hypothetical protein
MPICTIDGCESVATAKGLCAKHYMRLRRTGDAGKTQKPWANHTKRIDHPFPRAFMRDYSWSLRTYQRMFEAIRYSEAAGDHEMIIEKHCTWPNGKVNVSTASISKSGRPASEPSAASPPLRL